MRHLKGRPISVLRVGISYPGIGRNKVTFNRGPGTLRRVAGRMGGCTGRPIVVGLDPGMASVARVTGTTRTNNTSILSLVGALAKVGVSVGEHAFTLTGGANKVSNPTMGPMTIHVMCRITGTMSLPVVNVKKVTSTRSTLRFVVTNTATISIKATGFFGPCTAIRVTSNVRTFLRGRGIRSVGRLVKTIGWQEVTMFTVLLFVY